MIQNSIIDEKKDKLNKALFLAFSYYAAVLLLPIVQQVITVYVQITAVSFCLILVFCSRALQEKMFSFIFPFLLFVLLESIYGIIYGDGSTYNFIKSIYDVITVVLPAIVCYFLLISNNTKTIKYIVYVVLIFLFITSITSIRGLQMYPMASKMMAVNSEKDDVNLVYFNMKNIGGFLIAYMCPLVLPMLFASFKQKKIRLSLLVIITIPIIVYVIMTQYAIALLILFLSVFSFLLPKGFSNKKFMSLTITAIIFILVFRPIIGDIFYYISAHSESSMISSRFKAMADVFMGIGNDSDVLVERQIVYSFSIESFMKYPLLGSFVYGSGGAGGHSFILDVLANFGIMGGAVLFLLYRQITTKLYLPFKNNEYYGYMLWTFMETIILSILNPKPHFFIIALVVPLIAYLLQNKKYTLEGKKAVLLESD